jgi:hypothetical protein
LNDVVIPYRAKQQAVSAKNIKAHYLENKLSTLRRPQDHQDQTTSPMKHGMSLSSISNPPEQADMYTTQDKRGSLLRESHDEES